MLTEGRLVFTDASGARIEFQDNYMSENKWHEELYVGLHDGTDEAYISLDPAQVGELVEALTEWLTHDA